MQTLASTWLYFVEMLDLNIASTTGKHFINQAKSRQIHHVLTLSNTATLSAPPDSKYHAVGTLFASFLNGRVKFATINILISI